jgi:hypothetical protein
MRAELSIFLQYVANTYEVHVGIKPVRIQNRCGKRIRII